MYPFRNDIYCSESWSPFLNRRKIGGKALNLYRLQRAGFCVPRWLVVSSSVFEEVSAEFRNDIKRLLESIDFAKNQSVEKVAAQIRVLYTGSSFPHRVEEQLQELFHAYFENAPTLAVRSSVADEDSLTDSFAGQMDSYLNVPPEQVISTIEKVWASAYSARSLCYRYHKGLDFSSIQTAVIVQEMVQAKRAGVMFTRDPQTSQQVCVISSAWGLGEGVVNGSADTDTYRIGWTATDFHYIPREQEHRTVANAFSNGNGKSNGNGNGNGAHTSLLQNKLTLNDREVRLLRDSGKEIERHFTHPQDIEWAFDERGRLHFLQSRPIIFHAHRPEESTFTLWDNSNIIESYPGLTLPLTFSFIKECYETSFRKATLGFLISHKELTEHLHIFRKMIGLLDGRVYYSLLNWYKMLSFLPGFQKHKASWDQMIGISQKFSFASSRLSLINRIYAWLMVLVRLATVRANAGQFFCHFDRAYKKFRQVDFKRSDESELITVYESLKNDFSEKWHLTLYNDFCAMKYYDWLKRLCQKWIPQGRPNLHNDLLCGEKGVESVQPISSLLTIAVQIKECHRYQLLFQDTDDHRVWLKIQSDLRYADLKTALACYLDRFGDRGLEELKLENQSFRECPESLITLLREYCRRNLKLQDLNENERHVRDTAEQVIRKQLRWPWRRLLFWVVLANARRAIAGRENMRFARTRLIGIVRRLFARMADRLVTLDVLRSQEDLHYLTVPEIFDFIRGASVTRHLQAVADLRRYEYAKFAEQQPDSRIITKGIPYLQPLASVPEKLALLSKLQGIGCASGIAEGTAWVVTDPTRLPPYDDCILVAHSTDPGWVFLMIQSRGIVVEKGSLLSHTAIVGRELGIPTVVGVEGATTTIRQGSRLRINGETGEVVCR